MKISPKGKIYRKKGAEPGQPSCTYCCREDHEECETSRFIFCNCWRSKHTLDELDLHQDFRAKIVRASRLRASGKTKKKGSNR